MNLFKPNFEIKTEREVVLWGLSMFFCGIFYGIALTAFLIFFKII